MSASSQPSAETLPEPTPASASASGSIDDAADSTPTGPAKIEIALTPEGLAARLRVTSAGVLDRARLDEAIEKAGITFGVDETLAARLCADALGEGQSFTIAKGRNAQPELPARLKLEFDPELRPGTVRPDGTIDFSSRGALTPVAEGDIIAAELPPQTGTLGKTVKGEEIPFDKDTNKLKWSLGGNVTLHSGTGRITANIDGVISYEEGGKLDVVRHLEHRNPVDMRSGNLATQGSLTITGDVERNFYVRATEDVEVRGGVVGGSLYADGKASIAQGAIAGETGQIIVGGDVFLGHGQEAIVKLGGTLTVERDLVNSDVHAKEIIVKNSVVGGLVMAETYIEVKQAGGRGRTRTVLAVASPIPPDFEVPDTGTIDAQRAKRSSHHRSRSVTVGRALALSNLELPKTDDDKEARRALKAREKALRPKAKIRITGTISPGVVIRFGRLQYPIDREMASMEFSYDAEAKKMVRIPIAPPGGDKKSGKS